MKRALQSALLVAVTAVMVSQAQAQVVTYNYTAYGAGGEFGNVISGTITVDLAAVPSTPAPSSASTSEWRNVPGIKITAKTVNTTLFDAGTGSGGLADDTVVQQYNPMGMMNVTTNIISIWSWFGFSQLDGSDAKNIVIGFSGPNDDLQGLINKLPDPGSFLPNGYIGIGDASHPMAYYSVLSLTKVMTNILIGSVDTGIADITYQGQSVSATIAGYASSAKNHGDFVSRVTQLANALKKAGLLTEAQKSAMTSIAAQSNVGKKK